MNSVKSNNLGLKYQRFTPIEKIQGFELVAKKFNSFAHIYKLIFFVNLANLFVCLFPINVKTAEPVGPQFCVATNITPAEKEFRPLGSQNLTILPG